MVPFHDMVPGGELQHRAIGRYLLFDEIGAGGMATVHLGRLMGTGGFSRTVAIKRLHPHCARDPQFVSLFLDEARLAGRIRHPNVAAMLDVVSVENELLLVMEYIHGEPLSRLIPLARDRGPSISPRVAVAIVVGILHGLHAAHEAKSEKGEPLGVVHRDVSPQNVLVGADGVARLVDFGVAKAASRLQTTGDGQIKGKLAYMPPEQLGGHDIDRRVDVYAASVVLWEALAMKRLFTGESPGNVITRVLEMPVEPPSHSRPDVPKALDEVVLRGLAREPGSRFATAELMAAALESAVTPATPREVGQWVASIASESLEGRAALVSKVESASVAEGGDGRDGISVSGVKRVHVAGGAASKDGFGGSQISSISVASAPHAPVSVRRGPLRAWLPILLAAAALGVPTALFVRMRAKLSGGSGGPPSSAASLQPSAVTMADSASAGLSDTSAPATNPVPTTPASSPAAHRALHRSHTSPKPASPASAAPKPNCSPPYTVDPNDPRVHVPKPECL